MIARRGFVMLTVLWVLAAASTVALALALEGRDGVNAARNRVNAERAWARASDCLARARLAADAVLAANPDPGANAAAWRSLGALVAESGMPMGSECTATFEAAGTRLDVNAADSAQCVAVLGALGFGSASEAMTAALLDWRDNDDSVRALGAEADWYVQAGRLPPRNGPFADVGELVRVRGFEDAVGLDSVFITEQGRIAINSAGAAVLAAVPGFSDEAVERVLALRSQGTPVIDILTFASTLSTPASDAIIAHYREFANAATIDPDAWIVTATGVAGFPAVRSTIRVRMVHASTRAVVVRQWTW
ncbi:MAG: general secretion pathway protein GspK [Gemmatimonadaceae bacterium]